MHENVEKVKEEKRILEHQLHLFNKTRLENSKLTLEIQQMQQQSQEWRDWLRMYGPRFGVRDSPYSIMTLVSKLQDQVVELSVRCGRVVELEAQLSSHKTESFEMVHFLF